MVVGRHEEGRGPAIGLDLEGLRAGDLKSASHEGLHATLEAMLGDFSLEPDQFRAESRPIIVELLSRTAVARIKAELEKVPVEQRKAVLDAALRMADWNAD